MSEEWFEALGVLDYSRPVDAFDLVREMLAKRVARRSSNLMREEELLQLRLEKLPGR